MKISRNVHRLVCKFMETTENLYNVAYTIQLHWVLSRTIIFIFIESLDNLDEKFQTFCKNFPLIRPLLDL